MSSAVDITFVCSVGQLGGGERSLVDLLSELDRSDFTPRVVLPDHGGLAAALEDIDVSVEICPYLRRLRRRASAARLARDGIELLRGRSWLLAHLERSSTALIHANCTTAALFAVSAAHRNDLPLIWHVRDLVPLGWWASGIARRSARVIATSSCTEELARQVVAPAKVVRIPNGIDLERFAPGPGHRARARQVRASLGMNEEPLLLCVGQLVGWKRFDLVVEAAASLRDRLPAARWIVAGDETLAEGEGTRSVIDRAIERHGLAGVVRLVGHRPDVAELLAAADVLVHPAHPEPFGRVVVEAMASATPVVCAAGRHGPAESVRDGVDGRHVHAPDGSSLAQAVLDLLLDPGLRRRMGESGRERATELFGRRAMAQRCMELYRDLIA